MAARKDEKDEPGDRRVAVVKKYANRRLYNTASSSYVTLDELCQMVRDGEEFVVYDAKTGDDITRSVLTQIILEEDAKGRNLMPIGFLRRLIGFYDDRLNEVVPRYLELSMENFARHQEQMRGYMEETVGRFFPLKQLEAMNPFEDIARQNIAMLKKAANLFTPRAEGGAAEAAEEPAEASRAEETEALSTEMRELKAEMEALRRQMASMKKSTQGVKQD